MSEVYIKAENLSVEFPILENSHRSIKKALINVTAGGKVARDAKNHVTVRALDSISLDISSGERVGLIGHNGSGKTTLLRILAGTYEPTKGIIGMSGRIACLLDVAMGIDREATGYENIYLRALMMGLRPSYVESKIEEIAGFSELGEYLDLPVRTYSSGMMLRLAFAISTSFDADIIIMDEWLSVGDADFNVKAQERLKSLINKASILIIATHDFNLVDTLCTRKIKLEHGRIAEDKKL
jgi:lipopolysaccharide transport system ATP-binding protein